jgi:hypothetical protein
VRDRVYRRLFEVLTAADGPAEYANISRDERRLVLQILRETKPNLPAYWSS